MLVYRIHNLEFYIALIVCVAFENINPVWRERMSRDRPQPENTGQSQARNINVYQGADQNLYYM